MGADRATARASPAARALRARARSHLDLEEMEIARDARRLVVRSGSRARSARTTSPPDSPSSRGELLGERVDQARAHRSAPGSGSAGVHIGAAAPRARAAERAAPSSVRREGGSGELRERMADETSVIPSPPLASFGAARGALDPTGRRGLMRIVAFERRGPASAPRAAASSTTPIVGMEDLDQLPRRRLPRRPAGSEPIEDDRRRGSLRRGRPPPRPRPPARDPRLRRARGRGRARSFPPSRSPSCASSRPRERAARRAEGFVRRLLRRFPASELATVGALERLAPAAAPRAGAAPRQDPRGRAQLSRPRRRAAGGAARGARAVPQGELRGDRLRRRDRAAARQPRGRLRGRARRGDRPRGARGPAAATPSSTSPATRPPTTSPRATGRACAASTSSASRSTASRPSAPAS